MVFGTKKNSPPLRGTSFLKKIRASILIDHFYKQNLNNLRYLGAPGEICSTSAIYEYTSAVPIMPTATSPPPPSTLPPPHLFDILPPLHALLSRLLLPHSLDGTTPSPDTTATAPLSPKDLATAASSITNKIQKARVAVRELPGVEISIEEQEDVIAELEEESRRLRGVETGISKAARDRLGGAVGHVEAVPGRMDDGTMEM